MDFYFNCMILSGPRVKQVSRETQNVICHRHKVKHTEQETVFTIRSLWLPNKIVDFERPLINYSQFSQNYYN